MFLLYALGALFSFLVFVVLPWLLLSHWRIKRRVEELEQRLMDMPQRHEASGEASHSSIAPTTTLPVSQPAQPATANIPATKSIEVTTPVTTVPGITLPPAPPTRIGWWARLREHMRGAEWEAVVGGNWLNKLGVLVLVIGVGLFIAYSLTELGPAGRIAVGYLSGGAMLGGGLLLYRYIHYRIIGMGLMGGGWAVLYFTTYALHAVPAARLVQHPLLGFTLLLAVAGGIITHALRFRSETLMLVAYGAGYATLLLGQVPLFASMATLPLMASLLWVSWNRSWQRMSLAGVIFTYGAFLLLLNIQKVEQVTWQGLFISLGFLAIYWVSFEGFDLLRIRRASLRGGAARSMAPLNNVLWLGSSLVLWQITMPIPLPFEPRGRTMAVVAALFLASAWLRARMCPAKRYREPEADSGKFTSILRRFTAGGYELSLVLSTLLFLVAVWRLFDGLALVTMLVLEGQALFLGGLLLRDPFVRSLGSLVLALALLRVLGWDLYHAKLVEWGGWRVWDWAPKGLVLLVVAYYNRWELLRSFVGSRWLGLMHGIAGTVLLALVTWALLPAPLVAPVWGLLGMGLLELGYATGARPWRLQGHALVLAAFGRLFLANFANFGFTGVLSHRVLLVTPVVVLLYYLSWRMRRAGETQVEAMPSDHFDLEKSLRVAYLYLGALAAALLLRFELGRVAVVAGWSLMLLMLVYLGNRFRNYHLVTQGILLGGLVFARAWATNFYIPESLFGVFGRVGSGVFTTLAFFGAYFLLPLQSVVPTIKPIGWIEKIFIWVLRNARALFVLMGSTMLALLCFYEVNGRLLTLAWGAEAIALLVFGFLWRERLWRLSGLFMLAVSVGKLFIHDLGELETPYRILSFIVLGALMIAASWAYVRFSARLAPMGEASPEGDPPAGRKT